MRHSLRTALCLSAALAMGSVALACSGATVGLPPGGSCPSQTSVAEGLSCGDPAQVCASAGLAPDCQGNLTVPVSCTCTSGSWTACAAPPSTCPNACPTPAAVIGGAACSAPPDLGCTSEIAILTCGGGNEGFVTCTCTGGAWACADPGAPQCDDAAPPPTCPDPTKVNVGIPCMGPGLECPGNPAPCGQETFYDVFQCMSGTWTRTVATACDVDGG